MSQEKVNRYKEQKKNRKEEVKKQKLKHKLEMTLWGLLGVAIIGWFGYSIYNTATRSNADEVVQYPIDASALDNYVSGLFANDTVE